MATACCCLGRDWSMARAKESLSSEKEAEQLGADASQPRRSSWKIQHRGSKKDVLEILNLTSGRARHWRPGAGLCIPEPCGMRPRARRQRASFKRAVLKRRRMKGGSPTPGEGERVHAGRHLACAACSQDMSQWTGVSEA